MNRRGFWKALAGAVGAVAVAKVAKVEAARPASVTPPGADEHTATTGTNAPNQMALPANWPGVALPAGAQPSLEQQYQANQVNGYYAWTCVDAKDEVRYLKARRDEVLLSVSGEHVAAARDYFDRKISAAQLREAKLVTDAAGFATWQAMSPESREAAMAFVRGARDLEQGDLGLTAVTVNGKFVYHAKDDDWSKSKV